MRFIAGSSLVFSIILCLFAGCASHYRLIQPPVLSYSSAEVIDSVSFCYKYNILSESGNRKYARKERKEHLKIVAIKIVNNSHTTLSLKDNLQLFAVEKPITLIENKDFYGETNQSPASYILYLILTPVHQFSINLYGNSKVFPFGYILAPLLVTRNMIVAAKANKDYRYELRRYDLSDLKIPPDETVFGIIGFEAVDNIPLTIKRKFRK